MDVPTMAHSDECQEICIMLDYHGFGRFYLSKSLPDKTRTGCVVVILNKFAKGDPFIVIFPVESFNQGIATYNTEMYILYFLYRQSRLL